MTDKELLELAAKAAGVNCGIEEFSNGRCVGTNEYNEIVFDPLTDDGDAFRLAVKLRLPILDGFNGTVETGNAKSGRPIWELLGDDPYAATRRAIVRAAAEIGRGCSSL